MAEEIQPENAGGATTSDNNSSNKENDDGSDAASDYHLRLTSSSDSAKKELRRLIASTSNLSSDSAELEDSFGLLISLSKPARGSSSESDNPAATANARNDGKDNDNTQAPTTTTDNKNADEDRCTLTFVADQNFPHIHPNAYCPNDWEDLTRLGGGGSGVAVFSAHSPKLQKDLVLKHGGYKDLKELFALATIGQELKLRGMHNDTTASKNMQDRIPNFECIYISPHHLRDRTSQSSWRPLREIVRKWSNAKNLNQLENEWSFQHMDDVTAVPLTPPPTPIKPTDQENAGCTFEDPGSDETPQRKQRRSLLFMSPLASLASMDDIPEVFPSPLEMNSVRLRSSGEKPFEIEMEGNDLDSIAFCFGRDSYEWVDNKTIQLFGSAYESLESIVQQLFPLMHDRLFKFTLGQRSIAGPTLRTGNDLLYSGLLEGELLENFLDLFLQSIQDLQALTRPDESDVVVEIRKEVKRIETSTVEVFADDLADIADTFVGKAIKKNFRENGRVELLADLGNKFRNKHESLYLTSDEEFPAGLLGSLLRPGALMSESFENVPMEPATMQFSHHYWRNLLSRAVSKRRLPSALQRVWTCGLTDAGLHNLFYDVKHHKICFFDLGEPELQSLPGFLTKFLFSFFHTLGMQEDQDGSWIRRFNRKGNKLELTSDTSALLAKAYDAFERTLERVINELFDGDDSLRWLLIQYVTMQLLSDTAFCLQRWQVKGGGRSREQNHNKGIEKWLWRALWDVYIAYDINTQESWARLRVEHPLSET